MAPWEVRPRRAWCSRMQFQCICVVLPVSWPLAVVLYPLLYHMRPAHSAEVLRRTYVRKYNTKPERHWQGSPFVPCVKFDY
mgnify:CR=1 FL=1